jgi:hypothetical protein
MLTDSTGAVFGVWGDYDNDGDLDLFAPSRVSSLYSNNGTGRFERVGINEGGDAVDLPMLNPQAGHWGDYDGDGDLDLFLANFAIPPTTLTSLPRTRSQNFQVRWPSRPAPSWAIERISRPPSSSTIIVPPSLRASMHLHNPGSGGGHPSRRAERPSV